MLSLWDPVLILLSALTGATLLVPLIPASPAAQTLLFVGLLVAGIMVQASVLLPPRRRGA